MGHRAVIAEIKEDNSVEYQNSNWAAMSAFEADEEIDTEGDEIPARRIKNNEDKETAKSLENFLLNHINYTLHEAVWIDGICYYPWDRGLLIKCETSRDYNLISTFPHNKMTEKERIEYIESHENELWPDYMSKEDFRDSNFTDFLERTFGKIIDFRDHKVQWVRPDSNWGSPPCQGGVITN